MNNNFRKQTEHNASQYTTMEHDAMKQAVLEKIRTGQVQMRPKIYFTVRVTALVTLTFLVLLLSSLIVSFVIFSIKASGEMFLIGFGTRGLYLFFILFPWKLLLLDLVFIFLLKKLINYFRFGYRSPVIYVIAGVIVVTISVGLFIESTSLHRFMLRRERHRHVPVVGGFYQDANHPPSERGLLKGIVVSIEGHTFTVKQEHHSPTQPDIQIVDVPQAVSLQSIIAVGDNVFVVGTLDGAILHAFGIHKLTSEEQF